MKSTLFLSIVSLLISSCANERTDCCGAVSLTTSFIIRNEQGQNLLDPSTPGSYNRDSVKVFDLIKVNTTGTYRLEPPVNGSGTFVVDNKTGETIYYMGVNPGQSNDEVTRTLIRWNSRQQDTLSAQIIRDKTTTICKKVWFNGELKYDESTFVYDPNSKYSVYERFFETTRKSL